MFLFVFLFVFLSVLMLVSIVVFIVAYQVRFLALQALFYMVVGKKLTPVLLLSCGENAGSHTDGTGAP